MAGYVDPLIANCKRTAKATPFSVGAAPRPLCAHEKAERCRDASSRQPIERREKSPYRHDAF
jgi:hypothetical protein